jgi:hypothetical protein
VYIPYVYVRNVGVYHHQRLIREWVVRSSSPQSEEDG